ncbi:hypothetical protein M0805_008432 [Coniferiporia weirii]|nr:hypothetical protein M0805_008432 [Coniferiporia weirii]
MTDLHDDDGHRAKRFKHQSYNEQLKDVHAPAVLSRTKVDEALEDEACLFHGALSHWMQLNLSPTFIQFAQKAFPLSQSLPLLVHSWREITDLWLEYAEKSDDEALKALFDLMQKLVEDLRLTLEPAYDSIVSCLFSYLPRRISPESLSALLATMLALFKHLLLPSVPGSDSGNDDILKTTWTQLSMSLAKCNSEVQRAVAEVWSSVLRRLKKGDRQRCVMHMVTSGRNMDDVIAWSLVFSAKSVAQTLHTCSPTLVLSCLDFYLITGPDQLEKAFTLLRRLLTALVHHCAKADQFALIAGPLVEKFVEMAESTCNVEDAKRMLAVLVVPCSVRQGSRLSPKQLSQILDTSIMLPYTHSLRKPLLDVITAALCASPADLSVWISAGRRAIEHAWATDVTLAVSLTGALSELGWKGLTQFALPQFMKTCAVLLGAEENGSEGRAEQAKHTHNENDDTVRLQTLRVLSKLKGGGMLRNTDGTWRSHLAAQVRVWLDGFSTSEDSVVMLREIASLAPLFSSSDLFPPFSPLAQNILGVCADTSTEYHSSWANETWVFGQLVRVMPRDKLSDFDIAGFVCKAVMKWSWSEFVMDGISQLAKTCQYSGTDPVEGWQAASEQLFQNLKSHSQIIRRASLELLSLPWLCSDNLTDSIKCCLAAEAVPLSVQGVRERILCTARVGRVVQNGDARSAELCTVWLLGQLKVGLRPVWLSAAQALAAISQNAPDIVWRNVFSELKSIGNVTDSGCLPSWMESVDKEEDDVNEEERIWRDPSAHKFRMAVATWATNNTCRCAIIEEQMPRDRFDQLSYEAQLLSALGEFSTLTEKHSRELVPLLLSFTSPLSSQKVHRIKLTNWLKLFKKFVNPKAFYASDAVRSVYISLLAHPDRILQTSALDCLLAYKSPALVRHADRLRLLLDDAKWRDELAMLELHTLSTDERAELIPVLTRLFFGMMRERGGRGKGADRRAALLSTLGACTGDELVLLVDLMVEPFVSQVDLDPRNDGSVWKLSTAPLDLPKKQQIGFLVFLADVLRNLGTLIAESWPRLLVLTLTLTANAQGKLQTLADDAVDDVEEENENEADEEEKDDVLSVVALRQLRIIRQLGLKRLADFFRLPVEFDFQPYMAEIFRTIVSPRIPLLDRENTQAPSALLDLLDVWSLHPDSALYLVQYDPRTLTKIYDCMVATNVKPSVLMRIFDVVERLLAFSAEDDALSSVLVKPYMSGLLANVASVVQHSTEDGSAFGMGAVVLREISILSKLSPHITDGTQAATLLSLFLPQLRKSGKGVSERAKVDMLNILCNLLPRIPDFMHKEAVLFTKTYETLSHLFQLLRGRQARTALIEAFKVTASIDTGAANTVDLLASLNAYSTSRIEEPDFDRRLDAFAILNEKRWKELSGKEWAPLLHNMLHFIQDEGELSIRNNAASTMKRFLDALSEVDLAEMQVCFVRILFPGLKRCLRAKSDLVRAEVMGVLAHAVEKCDRVIALQEMRVLLAAGDEEANFFNNIFHIQIHRRNRALRRLVDYCDEPGFRSSTLQEIFIPVVNSFIAGSGTTDHHLVNEAVLTLGRIAKHLTWTAYFSLVQQYIKLATEKETAGRTSTRALVSVLDNFHFSMEDTFVERAANEEGADEQVDAQVVDPKPSATMKIHDAVNNRLLPSLLKHLEQRDELEESNRIPIAAGIAKVALHLPDASRDLQIPRLLTVLSQIFRSKSQETRDLTRETLCRIAGSLGPSYLPLIIRQLREALLRGPHLHVLAFVTHALLVYVTSPERVATLDSLDGCVPDAVHVSTEVVFGQSGKDVDSEGFKTKMKEVRGSSSKGMDSFAILAKFITPAATSSLLLPIKAIMQETESAKTMQVVDEVLRRMAIGLNANVHFGPAETLAFCHTLINQNAQFFQQRVTMRKRKAKKANDAVVQLKRKAETDSDHYSHNSWRFVAFGLDLFSTAYRRSRFDFHNTDVMARLEPLVNVIGNTLYGSNGNVVSSGLKATAQIVKCPLKNVEKSLPVFVRQILEIVRQTGNTEADVTQTAFKTLAVIIRDCSSSQLKEKDLTYLLELLTPDLEEVTRQATAFSLLRAIVSRKFVVPEIYDLMIKVGEIMVTSQSSQVQELCRGVLLQFLLDYPQGKARLRQQFAFLVKNLSYVFESGRVSVMEFFGAVITKFNDDIIADYADMVFVALVLVIANDDSTKCREMAAQLIKTLVARLREEQRKAIMSHVHSWASQHSNPALARVSSQTYGLVLDTLKADAKPYLNVLLDDVNAKVRDAVNRLEESEEDGGGEADWQAPYQALSAISKVFQVFPDIVLEYNRVSWPSITSLLLYPHAWVRTASSRLLGTLFSVTPVGVPDDGLAEDFPLSFNGMREVADALSLQLKSENLDEALSLQIVKNLFYIGKCFYTISTPDVLPDGNVNGDDDKEAKAGDSSDHEGEDAEESEDEEKEAVDTSNPLPWLFSRLSYQARSAHIAWKNRSFKQANWFHQPSAIFKWFAAMASHMDGVRLEQFLPHILSPLYRIAEDDTTGDAQMNELKTLCSELQDLVQAKVGTTKFAAVYNQIRQRVASVRRERRTVRVVQATTNPQAAAKRKLYKNAGKKESRKRKNSGFAEHKIRMTFAKRRKT